MTNETLFDPLFSISIPNVNDIIKHNAKELKCQVEQVTRWLETAHMVAFTIEQHLQKTDSESLTVAPLEAACVQIQPVIDLLCEDVKVQSEWSGLHHYIVSLKGMIETTQERHRLQKWMESILVQIEDISTMIFRFQEQRHAAAIYPVTEEEQESLLVEIDSRVGPLFHHVEKVYLHMTSQSTDASLGRLTRKHILVQERWECLRTEIDELKSELKADRWLGVFQQVADQVDEMIRQLETSTHFETRYKYYAPSIDKMLAMLGNGIASRGSPNEMLRRHEALVIRWNQFKIERSPSDTTSESSDTMKQGQLDTQWRLKKTSTVSYRYKSPVEGKEDDNMIITKQTMTRSATPNPKRSGTPSLIPRLTSKLPRPRSSMARIQQ